MISLTDKAHYAVIFNTEHTVHHEGDERSRTNPGHGYPAHSEVIKSIAYLAFETVEEVQSWIKFRSPYDKKDFRVIRATPMQVSTEVVVTLAENTNA